MISVSITCKLCYIFLLLYTPSTFVCDPDLGGKTISYEKSKAMVEMNALTKVMKIIIMTIINNQIIIKRRIIIILRIMTKITIIINNDSKIHWTDKNVNDKIIIRLKCSINSNWLVWKVAFLQTVLKSICAASFFSDTRTLLQMKDQCIRVNFV